MNSNIFSEKLAWFKQNERPEVVLLIANNPELIKIVVAWTSLNMRYTEKFSELPSDSESETREWLWQNTNYSLSELKEKIGIPFSEIALQNKLRPRIGNRIIYPDCTVNSFVERYLREQVINLFEAKKPVRKD